jgi:hypothetical protein
VLLDVGGHALANIAAEVEALAGVGGAHEAAEFHGLFAEVGDLEAEDVSIPELVCFDDERVCLDPSHGTGQNSEAHRQKGRGLICPVRRSLLSAQMLRLCLEHDQLDAGT